MAARKALQLDEDSRSRLPLDSAVFAEDVTVRLALVQRCSKPVEFYAGHLARLTLQADAVR